METINLLNNTLEEFSGGISYAISIIDLAVNQWSPPKLGWWKINYDVTFANGKAALAFMARDYFGLIIQVSAKCVVASSAFEAKTLAFN